MRGPPKILFLQIGSTKEEFLGPPLDMDELIQILVLT